MQTSWRGRLCVRPRAKRRSNRQQEMPAPHRNAPAAALGGLARAKALGPTKRRQIAKAAAAARWAKPKKSS